MYIGTFSLAFSQAEIFTMAEIEHVVGYFVERMS